MFDLIMWGLCVLLGLGGFILYLVLRPAPRPSPPARAPHRRQERYNAYQADLAQLQSLQAQLSSPVKTAKVTLHLTQPACPAALAYLRAQASRQRIYVLADPACREEALRAGAEAWRVVECTSQAAVVACVRQLKPAFHFEQEQEIAQRLQEFGHEVVDGPFLAQLLA
jgi:hypothetical protein